MVDQVQIVSVGNETNVPMWATEKAQQAMIDMMKNHYKVDERASSDLKKAFDEYVKNDAKESKKSLKDLVRSLEKIEKTVTGSTSGSSTPSPTAPGGSGNSIDNDLDDLRNDLDENGEAHEDNTKKVKKTTTAFDKFTKTLKEFASDYISMIKNIGGLFTENANIYGDMYRSGVQLNTTFAGVNAEASATRMTLEDFASTISANASIINQFGRKEFVKTVSAMSDNLTYLGVSGREAGEYIGEYLEGQRMLGVLDQITAKQRDETMKKNLLIATQFSQALGKSREEITKSMNATKMEIDSRIILARVPQDMRAAVEKNIETLGAVGGPLKDTFLRLMQAGENLAQKDEMIYQLRAAGQNELADQMIAFSAQAARGAADFDSMFEMLAKSDALGMEHLNFLLESGAVSKETFDALKQMKDDSVKAATQGMKAFEPDETMRQAQVTENAWISLMGQLKTIATTIFTPDMMEQISLGMTQLRDVLTIHMPIIQEKIKGISDFFAGLGSPLETFGWLTAAFLGLKVLGKVVMKAIKGLFNSKNWSNAFTKLKSIPSLLFGAIKKIPVIGWILGAAHGGVSAAMEQEGGLKEKIIAGVIGVGEGLLEVVAGIPMYISDLLFGTNLYETWNKWWDNATQNVIQSISTKGLVDTMFSSLTAFGNWLAKGMDRVQLFFMEKLNHITFGSFDEEIAEIKGRLADSEVVEEINPDTIEKASTTTTTTADNQNSTQNNEINTDSVTSLLQQILTVAKSQDGRLKKLENKFGL